MQRNRGGGRKDAEVGEKPQAARKHDVNRLELHKMQETETGVRRECETSDKRRQMCKERVKSNSAGKK